MSLVPKPRWRGGATGGPPVSRHAMRSHSPPDFSSQSMSTRPLSLERAPVFGSIGGKFVQRHGDRQRMLGGKAHPRSVDLETVEMAVAIRRDRLGDDLVEIGALPALLGEDVVGARQRQQPGLEHLAAAAVGPAAKRLDRDRLHRRQCVLDAVIELVEEHSRCSSVRLRSVMSRPALTAPTILPDAVAQRRRLHQAEQRGAVGEAQFHLLVRDHLAAQRAAQRQAFGRKLDAILEQAVVLRRCAGGTDSEAFAVSGSCSISAARRLPMTCMPPLSNVNQTATGTVSSTACSRIFCTSISCAASRRSRASVMLALTRASNSRALNGFTR